jgi:hypothetical protein
VISTRSDGTSGWKRQEDELEQAEAQEAWRAEHGAKLLRHVEAVLEPGLRVRDQFTISDVLWFSREIAVSDHRTPSEICDLQARVIRTWLELR